MNFSPIICFETHIELATRSKLFCGCLVDTDRAPNSNICPVCTGQPGTLPVLNEEALRLAILAGKALSCAIREDVYFARKNYFYPDLPKGFQISQDHEPLCENGYLEVEGDDGKPERVGIKRIHIEEDAGKLIHTQESADEDGYSLIDYNRASVPLIEIVMDHERNPLRGVAQARRYLEKLRHLIQFIGVSHALIEKGQFRSDVNISLKTSEGCEFNSRVEIKNMTSFKMIGQALTFEIDRQKKALLNGEAIIQETRLYDEVTHSTLPMRKKENAPDYRYFPEPDLPPVHWPDLLKKEAFEFVPLLPDEQAEKIAQEFSVPLKDARLLTRDRENTEFFYKAAETSSNKGLLVRWLIQDLFAVQNESENKSMTCILPKDFSQLVDLVAQKKITPAMGKVVLAEMGKSGIDPETIIQNKGLAVLRDSDTITALIRQEIARKPAIEIQLKAQEAKAINYLIGQVLQKTGGMADPALVRLSIIDLFHLNRKDR